jgi:hypothetical protein
MTTVICGEVLQVRIEIHGIEDAEGLLADLVAQQVRKGRCSSASEVVRTSLRLLE